MVEVGKAKSFSGPVTIPDITEKLSDIVAVGTISIPSEATSVITGVSYNRWVQDHDVKYHPYRFIDKIKERLKELETDHADRKEYIDEIIQVKKDIDQVLVKYI